MKVIEIPTPDLTFPDDPHRPKGLHLSDIIKDLMIQKDPDRYDRSQETREEHQAGLTKMQTGIAYERALERELGLVLFPHMFRPGSIEKDGIWMSPDGIEPSEWAIHEFKLTWYSSKKVCPTDPVYWPWVVQIKCYSRAIESQIAYLTRAHVNGDYKPPRPSPPQTQRLEFTMGELDQCWQMILIHRESMKKRGLC